MPEVLGEKLFSLIFICSSRLEGALMTLSSMFPPTTAFREAEVALSWPCFAIVWPFSSGLSKIVAKLLNSCVWNKNSIYQMTYRVSGGHVKLVTWGLWRPGGPTRHWAPTGTSCWSQKLWKHFVKVSKRSLWSYLKFPPHCSLHFGLKKVAKATKAAFYFFG